MGEVLRVFGIVRNHQPAAEQDYELASLEYEEACLRLDCTRPADVARFHAALDRLGRARDGWMMAREG